MRTTSLNDLSCWYHLKTPPRLRVGVMFEVVVVLVTVLWASMSCQKGHELLASCQDLRCALRSSSRPHKLPTAPPPPGGVLIPLLTHPCVCGFSIVFRRTFSCIFNTSFWCSVLVACSLVARFGSACCTSVLKSEQVLDKLGDWCAKREHLPI